MAVCKLTRSSDGVALGKTDRLVERSACTRTERRRAALQRHVRSHTPHTPFSHWKGLTSSGLGELQHRRGSRALLVIPRRLCARLPGWLGGGGTRIVHPAGTDGTGSSGASSWKAAWRARRAASARRPQGRWCPEERAGLFSRLLFTYVGSLIRLGYRCVQLAGGLLGQQASTRMLRACMYFMLRLAFWGCSEVEWHFYVGMRNTVFWRAGNRIPPQISHQFCTANSAGSPWSLMTSGMWRSGMPPHQCPRSLSKAWRQQRWVGPARRAAAAATCGDHAGC